MPDENNGDGGFDPDAFPMVESVDPSLPGTVELGVFSLSLTVADLTASVEFYEKLGFETTGGDADGGWLILKNGETTSRCSTGCSNATCSRSTPVSPRGRNDWGRSPTCANIAEALERAGVTVEQAIEPGSEAPGRSP